MAHFTKIIDKFLRKYGFHVQESNKPHLPWPTCFSTVDIAVVDLKKKEILLGRKPNKTSWVLFGGFADPAFNSDEEDAARELFEESTIIVDPKDLIYVANLKINDDRYKNGNNKIRTHLYMAIVNKDELPSVEIINASGETDDIKEVGWFTFDQLNEEIEMGIVNTISVHHVDLWVLVKNYISGMIY